MEENSVKQESAMDCLVRFAQLVILIEEVQL